GSGGRGGSAGTSGAAGSGAGGAAAYAPCPTNGDACKVLPLGDSITFGINYEGSYRVELFKRAVTAGQKITFVGSQSNGPAMAPGTTVPFPKNHEGWSGYTISMILAKAANDVKYGPHIILLHAGTNDTYMSDPSGAPMRLSSAVDSLASMFPDALIVVAKIIPYPSQTANVNLINQSIPAMVQSKQAAGKHVIAADLNTGFDTKTMLSSDTIHPNQTGYDWMGDTWYGVVGPLFPK
ncbi:MAG TPA: SGNH/GDSL hydrolase family protein, partial [Polyangia bacterium]|nr:SGNH/GDSL hydrolase family protein [Polyangia bacterium]